MNMEGIWKLCWKLIFTLFALLVLRDFLIQFTWSAGPFATCLLLISISTIAYFVREHRLHRDTAVPRASRPERTPILPRRGRSTE